MVGASGPGVAGANWPGTFNAALRSRPGSSGLGLAVCHRILEQHGGLIAVESRPGYGATFRLRLPRNAATRAGHSSQGSSEHLPERPPTNSSAHVAVSATASGAQL